MNLKTMIVSAGLLLGTIVSGEESPVVSFGALREIVSVDIRAKNVSDAVKQLIEQGGKMSPSVRHLKIEVDENIPTVEIRQNLRAVSVGAILLRIISLVPARLEVDESGAVYRITRVVETDGDLTRNYVLSEAVRTAMALSFESPKKAQDRLKDLGISLTVVGVNSDQGEIKLSGSKLQIRGFELLAASIALTNARVDAGIIGDR